MGGKYFVDVFLKRIPENGQPTNTGLRVNIRRRELPNLFSSRHGAPVRKIQNRPFATF
jgi:hypothetical protein